MLTIDSGKRKYFNEFLDTNRWLSRLNSRIGEENLNGLEQNDGIWKDNRGTEFACWRKHQPRKQNGHSNWWVKNKDVKKGWNDPEKEWKT